MKKDLITYHHFKEINSTNVYLKSHQATLANYTVVSADYQTAGHGRLGRVWESEDAHNVLMSMLVRENWSAKQLKLITLLVAIAIIKALNIAGLQVKWPNDIYYQGKKLAGILTEGTNLADDQSIIIGIGLNANQEDFPENLRHPAVSLKQITGRAIDINQLIKDISNSLVGELVRLKDNDFTFLSTINECLYGKGQKVNFTHDDYTKVVKGIGIIQAIADDGALVIKTDAGFLNIFNGEIDYE